jgi:hypothetical protein
LLSGGFEDQSRDFLRVRDQREMAGLHLDCLGPHPLGHEALEVRIDGAIFRGNGVVAGLEAESRSPGEADGGNSGGDSSEGERQPRPARKPPKVISPSDPSSAWTAKAKKRVQFGYGLNYLVDVEHSLRRRPYPCRRKQNSSRRQCAPLRNSQGP